MPAKKASLNAEFQHLVDIMSTLRGDGGCPWDREQTHESLRQFLLEEAHEVLETLDQQDFRALKEELGDLLLQIVFHAQIAAENQEFDIDDVIRGISDKLIRRHPNVFGDLDISSAAEQSVNWEKLKKQEGKSSVVDGVPKTLSALLRAWRIQQKASTVGFDWPVVEPVWEKVHEEVDELRSASENEDTERVEAEFGDLIFSLVNLSRFIGINPEDALRRTTNRFLQRFKKVELDFASRRKDMDEASLEELDEVWERVKLEERGSENKEPDVREKDPKN